LGVGKVAYDFYMMATIIKSQLQWYNLHINLTFLFVCCPDRVFGPESATQQVYELAAKDIALSALSGVNGTDPKIFN
jgi:hypothetical protein